MSKRSAEPPQPGDAQGDMEAGMTTAERRGRRRRGGSLRVPSDNVPRSRTPTAPPAPRPEDPALAMSIAYSFTNDASGPVARQPADKSDGHEDIYARTSAATIADTSNGDNGESSEFETKTREMTAVDLEALGLTDAGQTLRTERVSSPGLPFTRVREAPPERTSDVDVEVLIDAPDTLEHPAIPQTNHDDQRSGRAQRQSDSDIPITPVDDVEVELDSRPTRAMPAQQLAARRLATVALSEEDLEEVRAATSPSSQAPVSVTFRTQHDKSSSPPPLTPPALPSKPPTKPPPLAVARTASSSTPPSAVPTAPIEAAPSEKTTQLQAVDIEMLTPPPPPSPGDGLSAPEIDLSELAIRAESSGEIEVDVDADSKPPALPPALDAKHEPPKPPRAQTAPPLAPGTDRKSGSIGIDVAVPPPPPPAAHAHAPPAPPPTPVAKPPAPPPPQLAKKLDKSDRHDKSDKSDKSRGKPWFVDLFDEDYLRTLPFLTPQATQAEAEFVIDTLNLQPGAQVLDLGCGYGRHAMELAARGFHVVGLDLSTSLLLRGGEEAARRGLTINFVRGDMRELDFENQFDGGYCLFSTFGYFDDETNKKTLQNVARALKPNGKIVIEILNRDYVIADLPTRVWWEGEGCVVLEEVELNYFSSRIQVNRSVVFDDGRQLEQEISVRAYSLHEVGKLMHAAGFRVLEVSGGYQMRGRFFGNQSRHIIVLAERKETGS